MQDDRRRAAEKVQGEDDPGGGGRPAARVHGLVDVFEGVACFLATYS